jgi:hypothetical protein
MVFDAWFAGRFVLSMVSRPSTACGLAGSQRPGFVVPREQEEQFERVYEADVFEFGGSREGRRAIHALRSRVRI